MTAGIANEINEVTEGIIALCILIFVLWIAVTLLSLLPDTVYVLKSSKLENRLDYEWYRLKHKILNDNLESVSCIKKIEDIRMLIRYGASINPDYFETGTPFLRINNISNYKIDMNDVKFVNEETALKISSNFLDGGDILISRSGTIGISVTIPDDMPKLAFGSYMLKLILKDKIETNPDYVACFFNTYYGKTQFERITTGSNQRNITIPAVESILIPIPEKNIQEDIVKQINQAQKILESNILNVSELREKAELILQNERDNIIITLKNQKLLNI